MKIEKKMAKTTLFQIYMKWIEQKLSSPEKLINEGKNLSIKRRGKNKIKIGEIKKRGQKKYYY